MITEEKYREIRENYRIMAIAALETHGNVERAEYLTGVVRGLDLAFEHKYNSEKVEAN
jgi:hypothetical protein